VGCCEVFGWVCRGGEYGGVLGCRSRGGRLRGGGLGWICGGWVFSYWVNRGDMGHVDAVPSRHCALPQTSGLTIKSGGGEKLGFVGGGIRDRGGCGRGWGGKNEWQLPGRGKAVGWVLARVIVIESGKCVSVGRVTLGLGGIRGRVGVTGFQVFFSGSACNMCGVCRGVGCCGGSTDWGSAI